jgi:hypothetical protein
MTKREEASTPKSSISQVVEKFTREIERLNRRLEIAAKALNDLPVKSEVEVAAGAHATLSFRREGDRWNLFYDGATNVPTSPVKVWHQCSAESKMQIALHLPALREAMFSAVAARLNVLTKAHSALDQFEEKLAEEGEGR